MCWNIQCAKMWFCDMDNQLRGRRVCMLSRWGLFIAVAYHCCSVPQCIRFFQTPWAAAHHSSLCCTISQRLLKLMSIESLMPSNHLILCHPLLLLPSIFPSIRIFSNESALHIRWPKYWSFSFNISPSNEHQNWSPLGWTDWISLESKGLKSLLQHHSSKASILQHSAFFIIQLSHP